MGNDKINEEAWDKCLRIGFHSTKGGIGRTSFSLAFGIELGMYCNCRVLLVDLDIEAPAMHFFLRELAGDKYNFPEKDISSFLKTNNPVPVEELTKNDSMIDVGKLIETKYGCSPVQH